MKRVVISALVILGLIAAASYAEEDITVVVKEAVGKVQVLQEGKDWTAIHEGDKFPPGSEISTGFKSTAVLVVGHALLTIKPLTQMKLTSLIQQGNLVKTDLYLRVGKVKAEVNTPKGTKAEFKLNSPVATASVRGTIFDFDGETLTVERGVVELATPNGQARNVAEGESTAISSNGTVTAPVEHAQAQTVVASVPGPAAATGASTSGAQAVVPVIDTSASVVVSGGSAAVTYPTGPSTGSVTTIVQ